MRLVPPADKAVRRICPLPARELWSFLRGQSGIQKNDLINKRYLGVVSLQETEIYGGRTSWGGLEAF